VEGGRRKRAKFDSSVSPPTDIKELTPVENSVNVFLLCRSFRYLHLRKCQLLLQIHPSLQLVAWNINEHHSPSRTHRSIHFLIHNFSNHHKVTAMGLGSLGCILHLPLRVVVPVEALHILLADSQLAAHQMAIALEYCQRLTQQSAVACLKRIKMLPCN
jgi:hypothetical protein